MVKWLEVVFSARNVEPNCIRLAIDLTSFELGITCQRLPDLPARRSMRRRGSVWWRKGRLVNQAIKPSSPGCRLGTPRLNESPSDQSSLPDVRQFRQEGGNSFFRAGSLSKEENFVFVTKNRKFRNFEPKTLNPKHETRNPNVWLERSGNQTSRAGSGKDRGSE